MTNALLAEVAKTANRVVLIEDTRELQCKAPNLGPYAPRTAWSHCQISCGHHFAYVPTASPLAWGTGHPGGIGTIHAGTALGFALRKQDHTFASFLRALHPAQVSAGPDGKGSLSTFQTLAFSLAVATLITLLLLQTGTLVDLSGSILTLLGISGIGATIAKGTDSQRNTLSADNRAWLLRHGWIPMAKTVVDPSNATGRDFFTTDGVFDVYRYQSFIFGLVVIGGLIAAGANQLSTFIVPNTILGIVGLSQVVYIGGKLVTPTNISDVNAAIAGLRND